MIETLNQNKSAFYSISMSLLLASNGFFFGFGIGLFNVFGSFYLKTVHNIIKEDQDSYKQNLNFLFVFGGFMSCFFASQIYERLGRYRTLVLFIILNIVFTLFQLSSNILIVYVFRFLSGFNSVVWTLLAPLYIVETCPPKYRRMMDISFYIFLTAAILLAYSLSGDFAVKHWYLCIIIPIFLDFPKLALFLFYYR